MNVSVRHDGASNNACTVFIGYLSLHFSYTTLIAYDDNTDGKIVSENRWSRTTGKHLNAIDGGNKKTRLPKEEFDAKVAAMVKRHGLDQF